MRGTPLSPIFSVLPQLNVLQVQRCMLLPYEQLKHPLTITRQSLVQLYCADTFAYVVYWYLSQLHHIDALKIKDILVQAPGYSTPHPLSSHRLVLNLLSISTLDPEMLPPIELQIVPNTLRKLYFFGQHALISFNPASAKSANAFLQTVSMPLEHFFCLLPEDGSIPCKPLITFSSSKKLTHSMLKNMEYRVT